jgi:hypothetical protein
MSIPTQHHADLADLSYAPPKIDETKSTDDNIVYEEIEIDGVKYEPLAYKSNPATGYQGTIYQRMDTGEIVVAHRGTEGKKLLEAAGWKDVGADGAMLAARVNPQTPDAIELTEKALEIAQRYARREGVAVPEVTVTGHSLGGCLAQITAHKFHLRGETFNAYGAASLGYGISEGGHTVVNHVMATDVVSAASPHFGQVRVYATPGEIAALGGPLGRYNNDGHWLDERIPVIPLIHGSSMHSMHHFTRTDANDQPDRSVLNDPQAQQLAAQHSPMIQKFRGDIGMTAAGVMLAGDAVRAVGEQQLRRAEQQQAMAQQLSDGVGKTLSAAGQHRRHQAEQQLEANLQLRQGIAEAAGYIGQTIRNVAEVGRDVLERAAATPSLHQQAKIGILSEGQHRRDEHRGAEPSAPPPLIPFSDAHHPKHALYADVKQRLEAQGHHFPEDRLNQITGQLHKSGFKPGWEGQITVAADKVNALDYQNLWNGRTHIALAEPAPTAQQTMQEAQQHDQDRKQQAMEWQQRQEQARSQSGAMR